MDNQKYYFITVMSKLDDSKGYLSIGASRTWGFYTTLEQAFYAVSENISDLWETIYDYAVIEAYNAGISGYCFERWFFKYNQETEHYDPIQTPEAVKHYAGFALG